MVNPDIPTPIPAPAPNTIPDPVDREARKLEVALHQGNDNPFMARAAEDGSWPDWPKKVSQIPVETQPDRKIHPLKEWLSDDEAARKKDKVGDLRDKLIAMQLARSKRENKV